MVVKKQIPKCKAKMNPMPDKKQKFVPKKVDTVQESHSEDDLSFDNMSEDELKKMLGNCSNSGEDSGESSEEEIVSTEAKVNKKRKLDSDDEIDETLNKKFKFQKSKQEDDEDEDLDEEEEEDDEDIDDEDDDMEDDSFINDETEEEAEVTKHKPECEKKKSEFEKKIEINNSEINLKSNVEKIDDFKLIYEDTPKIESESLRKEISDRILDRKNKTIILIKLPYKFNYSMAKELVPDMVSIIIPYDARRHQIKGNAYIDLSQKEHVQKYCKSLGGLKIKNNKISCFPFTKVDDNVDNYNCTRLVISNLSPKTTIESLKRIMTKATNIRMMPIKKADKKMTLIAFAEYPCVEDAIFDYDTKHGIEFEGMPINVKFQSKSNTNVKKTVAYDKKALHVIGINKSITLDKMKQLFPQAIKINWKFGDQMASVTYGNVEDCSVDFQNAVKNKPCPKLKIFYKFDRSKKSENEKKEDNGKKVEVVKEKKPEFKQKKETNKKESEDNKKKFDSKKKFNGKNSKNRNYTAIEKGLVKASVVHTKETGHKEEIKEKIAKPFANKTNQENLKTDLKTDKHGKNKETKIKTNLINKKKQEKRAKKLMKKKLRKQKNIK